MDREAHGESFSSQKDNLEVIDIRRGAFGEAVHFGFSDGSSFFIHPEAALEYGIRTGTEISLDKLREVLFRSAAFAARDKAVDYLARREHSASELILKLRKKDYDHETAAAAVDMLKERGYVNDRRFAQMWVESRLRKHPEGRGSLLAGLARKGVSREEAQEVVSTTLTEEVREDALSRCTEKFLRTKSADRQGLLTHLRRRGFDYTAARHYVDELGLKEDC